VHGLLGHPVQKSMYGKHNHNILVNEFTLPIVIILIKFTKLKCIKFYKIFPELV